MKVISAAISEVVEYLPVLKPTIRYAAAIRTIIPMNPITRTTGALTKNNEKYVNIKPKRAIRTKFLTPPKSFTFSFL